MILQSIEFQQIIANIKIQYQFTRKYSQESIQAMKINVKGSGGRDTREKSLVKSKNDKGIVDESGMIKVNHHSHQSTTLHKKSISSQKLRVHSRTVSPFSLQSSEKTQTLQKNYHKKSTELAHTHLQRINSQYANLFHDLTVNYPKLAQNETLKEKVKNEENEMKRMGKDDRCRVRCENIIKRNELILKNIEDWKLFQQNWRILCAFVQELKSEQIKDKQAKVVNSPIDLIQYYQENKELLNNLCQAHEKLKSRTLQNLHKNQSPQDSSQNIHYKLEKAYKRLQRKLNKQMEQVLFYDQKCKQYQDNLELLQQKINRAQQTNTKLDMKIIHEKGRKEKQQRAEVRRKRKLTQNKSKKESPSKKPSH